MLDLSIVCFSGQTIYVSQECDYELILKNGSSRTPFYYFQNLISFFLKIWYNIQQY